MQCKYLPEVYISLYLFISLFQTKKSPLPTHLHPDEPLLPAPHLRLERLHVGRAAHGLRLHDMIVQQHLDLVHGRQDADARVSAGGRRLFTLSRHYYQWSQLRLNSTHTLI